MEGTSSAKGRLAEDNLDVFNLFSATLFFPVIRLMLSRSTDLTMSVEFYDLMSAFLVPKLKGSFIVMRMPPNEDGSHGQVLALLMAITVWAQGCSCCILMCTRRPDGLFHVRCEA